MTETKPDQTGDASTMWGRLAALSGDPSGAETFARYRWQAKQVVRQWLTCLPAISGPHFVVCEHVEDMVLVYPDKLRFVQLKTRDRGSWSAANMCSSGIDSLVRSYTKARGAGVHIKSLFELWLEGPISELRATVRFAEDPRTAAADVREKILTHGLKPRWVNDFLSRLVIHPNQPTQKYIDARAIYEMGAVWPGTSRAELEIVYERLLMAATAAQDASETPAPIHALLAATIENHLPREASFEGDNKPVGEEIMHQTLSRAMIIALTPPVPESIDQLTQRMSAGSTVSLMELKMRAGVATARTIREAKELRAEMEIKRQLLLASRINAEESLEELARRTLTMARAVAGRTALDGAVNPAQAHRPAEAIAMDLLSRLSDLSLCDRDQLFAGDPFAIYGYLAHLSDECRFPWRAA